jgi:hypothetical protein
MPSGPESFFPWRRDQARRPGAVPLQLDVSVSFQAPRNLIEQPRERRRSPPAGPGTSRGRGATDRRATDPIQGGRSFGSALFAKKRMKKPSGSWHRVRDRDATAGDPGAHDFAAYDSSLIWILESPRSFVASKAFVSNVAGVPIALEFSLNTSVAANGADTYRYRS